MVLPDEDRPARTAVKARFSKDHLGFDVSEDDHRVGPEGLNQAPVSPQSVPTIQPLEGHQWHCPCPPQRVAMAPEDRARVKAVPGENHRRRELRRPRSWAKRHVPDFYP